MFRGELACKAEKIFLENAEGPYTIEKVAY